MGSLNEIDLTVQSRCELPLDSRLIDQRKLQLKLRLDVERDVDIGERVFLTPSKRAEQIQMLDAFSHKLRLMRAQKLD